MQQYQNLVRQVLADGHFKGDRTGVGTRSIFGAQMRFDLQKGFPLCTTKKVPFRSVLSELLWFLMGSTNVNVLRGILHGEENMVSDLPQHRTIWDDNYENQAVALGYGGGDLGPVYGSQWRNWFGVVDDESGETGTIDQIAWVVNEIKKNPDSRRLVVSAWNIMDLDRMALPPCHCLFQFYVHDGKLSCQLYQRSADLFLGVPFNIASYALLVHIIAQVCGLQAGEFVWTGGDVHLYENHVDQAYELLSREPRNLPTLMMKNCLQDFDQFTMDDFAVVGYDPHPPIKAPMAI